MEYVFEDFIFGFIEQELEEILAKAQRSDNYLDEFSETTLAYQDINSMFEETQEAQKRSLQVIRQTSL